jgi:quercetin dioxygenase-like cupin family protein
MDRVSSAITSGDAVATPAFDRDVSERLWHLGSLILVRLAGADTSNEFTLIEAIAPIGYGAPLHRHARESETLVLLDGRLTVSYEDREVDVDAPGAVLHFPKLVAHGFVVKSQTAHLYSIFSPAGFESFFRALSTPASALELPPPPDGPPDFELVGKVAYEHGLELIGPPGPGS